MRKRLSKISELAAVGCICLLDCGQKQGTVHWESKLTGFKGHGQPIDYQTAKAWADKGNREHPEIRHWVE